MVKLLSLLILPLMLLQALVFTIAVRADEDPCKIQDILSTLPATDITPTTAVFHGRETEVYSIRFMESSQTAPYPWIFKYGTQSGIYTKQVRAHLASLYPVIDETRGLFSIIWDDAATVTGLTPCTTYYVLYTWDVQLSGSASASNGECHTDFRNSTEITFRTPGCLIQPLGAGGSTPGMGTSSGLSSVPVSAPVQMASVVVQSAAVSTPKVSPGQSVDIAASVTNKGAANGDAKLTLYVNGEVVESKGVTVAGGQTAPVHFYVSRNEPGTYSVSVNSVPAGSFTVDMFTGNDNLIYGIMALLLIGIAGTAYLLMRKRTA